MIMIWHNGTFIADEPVFTAHDRMRIGECAFSTMLAVDGRPVSAAAHMDKLERNTGILFGETPPGLTGAGAAVTELLRLNNFTQGRHAVNVIVTGGGSGNGIRPPEQRKFEIVIRAARLAPGNEEPVRAAIAHGVRRNELSPLSRIKGASYGEHILALREAAGRGANEALILNTAGNIACASTASVAVVLGGQLVTPPLSDGGQDSVTRTILIERHGAVERSLSPADLASTNGIYLLNSLRGAVALASLDGRDLPTPAIPIEKDFHIV